MRVVFRETTCLDPVPSKGSAVLIIIVASSVILISAAAIFYCKVRKRACFSNDKKISIKESDYKEEQTSSQIKVIDNDEMQLKSTALTAKEVGVGTSKPARVNWQDPKELEEQE